MEITPEMELTYYTIKLVQKHKTISSVLHSIYTIGYNEAVKAEKENKLLLIEKCKQDLRATVKLYLKKFK